MQRSEAIPPGLREFATWNFSKANCEFSFVKGREMAGPDAQALFRGWQQMVSVALWTR
jgi:hypothetical protein